MKSKKTVAVRIILLIITIAMGLFAVAFSYSLTHSLGNREISGTKLKSGWQITYHGESYSNCDLDSFIFSGIKKGDTVEIATAIPEDIPDNEALLVYEEYHDIHVFLDGREVFTREAERLKEDLPLASGFYLSDIGDMEAGDSLIIRMTAGRDNAFDSIHYPSIVNGTTFYQDYMSSRLLLLVQVVAFVVIGTFMAIFAMVMGIMVFKGDIDGFRLVSLSLFSIAIGVWILCRENLFEIFSDQIIAKDVMRLLAFYLFPVFYIGYQFGKRPDGISDEEIRPYRIRNMIFGLEWLVSIIIYAYVCYAVIGLHRYATDFLTLYHILFAIVIITAVSFGIYDLIKKRRRYAVSTIATLIVGGVAIADLLVFYSMTLDSNTGTDTHVTGPIYYALIFLILSFAWEFIVNTTRDMKAETRRAEMYGREKDLAERSNKAKSAFLANMSHEIRTPINTVLGLNTMIMRESSERPIREYARDIRSAGQSLLSIINDILDSSKIESGKMEIVPVKYYFTSVLHDTVNMVCSKAAQKGLKFEMDIDENIPRCLIGDDVRIRQIIVNLLTNAVKYTNEGSVVLSINARPEGDDVSLHVSVKDTGIGIKKEDLPQLFDKFVRVDMEKNRNIEGTGLGMSICTQLLALMGSELKVESEYGRGSEFMFDLKQGVADRSPVGRIEEQPMEETEDQIYRVSFVAPDANVLVVDDNDMNRNVFRSLIKGTKVRVTEASSGKECIALAMKQHFDIIYLDHMMPEMDGIETLRRMREIPDFINAKTPVIALTANAIHGAREEYLEAGFNDYLSKPIDPEKLEGSIRNYLPADLIKEGSAVAEQDLSGASESTGADLPDIKGFQFDRALKKLGGDKELLSGAIDVYMASADSVMEKLDKQLTLISTTDDAGMAEAMKAYGIQVHSMKSNAAYIGAYDLSDMAASLEAYAKDQKADAILSLHPLFSAMWKESSAELTAVFSKDKSGEKRIDFDPVLIKGNLELLKMAMLDMDVDRADQIMGELTAYGYSSDVSEKMDALKTAVNELDSDVAAELADELIGMI